MNSDQPSQEPNSDNEEFSTSDNGIAIAGFILAFLLAPLGLIFSIVGFNKANEVGGQGRDLAIAGIVISGLFTLIPVLWLILLGFSLRSLESDFRPESEFGSRSAFVIKQFNADETNRSVLVASGDIEKIETASGQFRYQPAQPQTCRYLLLNFFENRSAIDIDQRLVAYSDYLVIDPNVIDPNNVESSFRIGSEYYVIADGCGDWQLVDNLI